MADHDARPADPLDTPASAALLDGETVATHRRQAFDTGIFIPRYRETIAALCDSHEALRTALSEARARVTELEAALNAAEYEGDGFCVECGDEFHLDDTGGYNPPCSCGMHCRSCHAAEFDRDDLDDDYPEDDDAETDVSGSAT